MDWITQLEDPVFTLFGQALSWRDLILAGGGLFLIAKSTHEIHDKLEGEEGGGNSNSSAAFLGIMALFAVRGAASTHPMNPTSKNRPF